MGLCCNYATCLARIFACWLLWENSSTCFVRHGWGESSESLRGIPIASSCFFSMSLCHDVTAFSHYSNVQTQYPAATTAPAPPFAVHIFITLESDLGYCDLYAPRSPLPHPQLHHNPPFTPSRRTIPHRLPRPRGKYDGAQKRRPAYARPQLGS